MFRPYAIEGDNGLHEQWLCIVRRIADTQRIRLNLRCKQEC